MGDYTAGKGEGGRAHTIFAAVLRSGSPPRSSRPPCRASCVRKSSAPAQAFSLYARRCTADQHRLFQLQYKGHLFSELLYKGSAPLLCASI